MNKIMIVFMFLFGCTPQNNVFSSIKSMFPARLLIVSPTSWMPSIAQLTKIKYNQGFDVSIFNVEDIEQGSPSTWGANLAKKVGEWGSGYVILAGDESNIPTNYMCSDINYSSFTNYLCIPSDYPLVINKNNQTVRAVGRIPAANESELLDYIKKESNYHPPFRQMEVISDRAYGNDDVINSVIETVKTDGVSINGGVVNQSILSENDNLPSVGPSDVDNMLYDGVNIIGYYGHGGVNYWGNYGNITAEGMLLNSNEIASVVFAEACQTAKEAPIPPYDPYISNGVELNFSKSTSLTEQNTGKPDSIQPGIELTDSIGKSFTLASGGSMVYVGEEVITSVAQGLFQSAMEGFAMGNRVGDEWYEALRLTIHPEYFMFFGDPTVNY